jgi:hypothetical protein
MLGLAETPKCFPDTALSIKGVYKDIQMERVECSAFVLMYKLILAVQCVDRMKKRDGYRSHSAASEKCRICKYEHFVSLIVWYLFV